MPKALPEDVSKKVLEVVKNAVGNIWALLKTTGAK